MSLFGNPTEVMNIAFGIGILKQNASILSARKINLKHVIDFHSQSQRLTPSLDDGNCLRM